MKKFLKFYWNDSSNKGFILFEAIYIALFHVLGYFVPGINMQESSLWSFDVLVLLIQIVLTVSTYKDFKRDQVNSNAPDLNMH